MITLSLLALPRPLMERMLHHEAVDPVARPAERCAATAFVVVLITLATLLVA